jgi:hypothetical protein
MEARMSPVLAVAVALTRPVAVPVSTEPDQTAATAIG